MFKIRPNFCIQKVDVHEHRYRPNLPTIAQVHSDFPNTPYYSVHANYLPYLERISLRGCTCMTVRYRSPYNRPPRAQRGSRGIAILILNLGTRKGWVVSAMPRPLYPQERSSTHCTGGWVGPRASPDVGQKSRPHRDSIPGPSSP
jgi:hypothetical protein